MAEATMEIVDSHQHFWELGRFAYDWLHAPQLTSICRDFLPADLRPRLDAVGVDRSVFVQTQHATEENLWVLQLAEDHPWIAGVVGWVDLASPACGEQLDQFRQYRKFVGVRHVTHDEPDPDFIIRPDVIRGLKELQRRQVPFDLLFFVQHLTHAATLARELPELPLVIDHLAKPHIKAGTLEDWKDAFLAAAQFPNVYCKLSGMVTEADWDRWTASDLLPYVELALEAFGPSRCMFGSDWPVCELAGTYEQVFRALETCVGTLSDSERALIWGGTAKQFYQLPDA